MKKYPIVFIPFILTGCMFVYSDVVFAQENKKPVAQNAYAPQTVKVDGLIEEWAPELFQKNKTSKLSFLIANNDSTLFFVVKSSEKADLQRLLAGGISLALNTTGQKKAQETLTFPIMRGKVKAPAAKISDPAKELNKALNDLKEIGVSGFDFLLDGKIAMANEYGIRAAARVNDEGLLICEYALPMKLLHSDGFKSDNFACQIRVNGLNTNLNHPFSDQNFNRGMIARPTAPQRIQGADFLEGTAFWIVCRLATQEK